MFENLKKAVCLGNKQLVQHKLVLFTWGNLSAIDRQKNIIAIKPSGIPYNKLQPKDIVILDLDGNIIEGEKKPSSDTKSHLEIYKAFKNIGSIVHTHSLYATCFAQANKPLECLGTTHADHFYGTIPITKVMAPKEVEMDYEKNIGASIVNCFQKQKINPNEVPGCLVVNHGPFVWGKKIEQAIYNAVVLETIAKMNLNTIQINSNIKSINKFLLDKHYLRKNGKNSYYGQK